jgi:hypothetical protein
MRDEKASSNQLSAFSKDETDCCRLITESFLTTYWIVIVISVSLMVMLPIRPVSSCRLM